jgi:hypothetical protein
MEAAGFYEISKPLPKQHCFITQNKAIKVTSLVAAVRLLKGWNALVKPLICSWV